MTIHKNVISISCVHIVTANKLGTFIIGSLFTARNAKSIQPCQSSHYRLTIIYVLQIEDASTNISQDHEKECNNSR